MAFLPLCWESQIAFERQNFLNFQESVSRSKLLVDNFSKKNPIRIAKVGNTMSISAKFISFPDTLIIFWITSPAIYKSWLHTFKTWASNVKATFIFSLGKLMLFDIQQDKWWFTWKNEVHHIQCFQLLQYFWVKL